MTTKSSGLISAERHDTCPFVSCTDPIYLTSIFCSHYISIKLELLSVTILLIELFWTFFSESEDKIRLQIELEFVQCLANPNYLNCKLPGSRTMVTNLFPILLSRQT